MEPIGLGVIGLGGRGRGMADLAHSVCPHLFRIIAVCDLFPHRMNAAGDAYGIPPEGRTLDYRELVANPAVEAVLVETGAQVFAEICLAALNAGKHVAADVPMAFTRQDVWDLVIAVERTGLTYCMGEQVRFANFVERWKEHVERGDIGEPLFVQGEYIHPEPGFYFNRKDTGDADFASIEQVANDPAYEPTWRNTFLDPIKYIPHELSPLLKIIDDRVVSVSCYTSDARMYGDAVQMLDLQCAIMRTAKGRTIRIVNSFTAPRKGAWSHHWYHIMGTDGVLESARPYWGEGAGFVADAELLLDREGQARHTNYGWARPDPPFGDASMGHAGLEAFFFRQYHDAIRGLGPNESDVYAMAESMLPGVVAAESAAAGGVMMEVPDVRPGTARLRGEYPAQL